MIKNICRILGNGGKLETLFSYHLPVLSGSKSFKFRLWTCKDTITMGLTWILLFLLALVATPTLASPRGRVEDSGSISLFSSRWIWVFVVMGFLLLLTLCVCQYFDWPCSTGSTTQLQLGNARGQTDLSATGTNNNAPPPSYSDLFPKQEVACMNPN